MRFPCATRTCATALAAILVAGVWFGVLTGRASALVYVEAKPLKRVAIILVPGLDWESISSDEYLRDFVESSYVANVSVRSREELQGRVPDRTELERMYLGDIEVRGRVPGAAVPLEIVDLSDASDPHGRLVMVLRELERAGTLDEQATLVLGTEPMRGPNGVSGYAACFIHTPARVYPWGGLLTSSATQRNGLLVGSDVRLLVESAVAGLEALPEGVGFAFEDLSPFPFAHVIAFSEVSTARFAVKDAVMSGFIGICLLIYGLAIALLAAVNRGALPAAWNRVAGSLALVPLTIPLASWLQGSVSPSLYLRMGLASVPGQVGMFVGISVFMSTWVVLAGWRTGLTFKASRVLTGLTFIVLGDVALLKGVVGFDTFLSYTPLQAARYFGLGNEGAALSVFSAALALALIYDVPARRDAEGTRGWTASVVALAVFVTAASVAPGMGANLGVALWSIPTFGVMWLLADRRRITLRFVAVCLLGLLSLVTAAVFLDFADGVASTHFGRLARDVLAEGPGLLLAVMAGRLGTSLRIVTATAWSVPFFLGYLAMVVVALRRSGSVYRVLSESPHTHAALVASLAGGALAFFVEDSGIVIPALALLLCLGVTLVLLAEKPGPPVVTTLPEGGEIG